MTDKELVKELDSRIQKGIRFLDRKIGRKKWSKKIDLDSLDLSSPNVCMIGEVMGGYSKGARKFKKSNEEMAEMGFYDDSDDNYPLLTRLWIGALYKLGIKG